MDKINALDYFSSGLDDGTIPEENSEDAPEISNKVIFTYSVLTSMLTIRYYYRYIHVQSTRGKELLSKIHHRLANIDDGDDINSPIIEGSTFYHEGNLYRTLPHFAHMTEVGTVSLVDDTERSFLVSQVRELIARRNDHNNNNDMNL